MLKKIVWISSVLMGMGVLMIIQRLLRSYDKEIEASKDSRNEYNPDVVSAPGQTLLDILYERNITVGDLVDSTMIPWHTLEGIFRGTSPITPDIANEFERILGTPADFWLKRERDYREANEQK